MSAYVFHAAESRLSKHRRRRGEREVEEQEAKSFQESLCKGVEPPPFDPTSTGPREEWLDVPMDCIGMLIGKKGENLKRVEQQCKVKVQISDGVDAQTRTVTVIVRGLHDNVATALRELDFATELFEVPAKMMGWVCGKGAQHLKLIRELSGAAAVSIRQDERDRGQRRGAVAAPDVAPSADRALDGVTGDADPAGRCWLELKGRRSSVADARMCLEAHMSYYPAFQDMEKEEADLDKQIVEAQAQLGRRPSRGPAAPEHAGRSGAVPDGAAAGGSGARRARGGRGGRSGRVAAGEGPLRPGSRGGGH